MRIWRGLVLVGIMALAALCAAEIPGGTATAGAVIGAIAGGGKGVAIGAGAGAAAGTAGAAATGKQDVSLPAETVLTFTIR